MTKLHRKDLKQDEIREKVSEAVHSVSLHSREVVYIILIVLGIGAIAAGWYYYGKTQQEKSQNLLGLAMEKLNGSVGPQTPENPNPNPNHFNTDAEKYRAALKDFQQIITQYGSTSSADMAQYEAGIC